MVKGKATEWINVADEITDRLGGAGNAEFSEWIEEQVGHLTIKDDGILSALRTLGCLVATTNYDDILSSGLRVPPITWDDPGQVHRFLMGNTEGVLHLHGHWRRPQTIVLGSRSYDELDNSPHRDLLSSLSQLQNTVIYVGCSSDGLSDPDFTNIAEFVKNWQQTAPRSYWLVKDDQLTKAVESLAKPNPRLFPISFGENHADLTGFLLSLTPATYMPDFTGERVKCIEYQEPRPDLFGRDIDIRNIEAALLDDRSVVIGGGPGFGKTALAVGALYRQRVIQKFSDRRVFVSLEAEKEPRALLASLAATLGVSASGDEPSLLRQIHLLANTPIVAILDNAEFILESARGESERILRLLAQIPRLCIVVTTRGGIPKIPGALLIHDLQKLDQKSSEEAFLNIAGENFHRDPDLKPLIETLDGHALSIELVAARAADGATLAGIRAAWQELRASLLKKMGEAEGRLTSVRASLALSLQAKLLTGNPLSRRLISILSVLPAGVNQSAIARLLGKRGEVSKSKALDATLILQQLKLVERRLDDRVRMLTPLREAARLDVSLLPAVRQRILHTYLEIASQGDYVGTLLWKDVRELVESEAGNLESVLAIAVGINHDPGSLYRAYNGLAEYYRFSGEGSVSAIEYGLGHISKLGNSRLISSMHAIAAGLAHARDDIDGAKRHYEAGLRLALNTQDSRTIAHCYAGLGRISAYYRNLPHAESYFFRAEEQYSKAGDTLGRANVMAALARLRWSDEDAEALGLAEKAGELYKSAGDELGMTHTETMLAEMRKDDLKAAFSLAAERFSQLGALSSEVSMRTRLAFTLQASDQFAEASRELDLAIAGAHRCGFVDGEAEATIVRGIVARRSGEKNWRQVIEEGFILLRMALREDDKLREGYNALEIYLTADTAEVRSIASEKAKLSWDSIHAKLLSQVWLTTPTY